MTVSGDELAVYEQLHAALSGGRYESLAQAAFRTVRHNIAPEHIQHVARMVLAGSQKSPAHQWEVFRRCAAVLDQHATSRKDTTT